VVSNIHECQGSTNANGEATKIHYLVGHKYLNKRGAPSVKRIKLHGNWCRLLAYKHLVLN
jgi:hypothetical protein